VSAGAARALAWSGREAVDVSRESGIVDPDGSLLAFRQVQG
jgi:hypothetical protein